MASLIEQLPPIDKRKAPAKGVTPPIRVAIAGAGFIADYHLEILREIPGTQVVGICDPNLARCKQVADRWGIAVRTASVEELLAQAKPAVVHVLAPPSLHVEVARKVLESGAHVMLEKPLALCLEDAESLSQTASTKGLHLGVNHNWVHQPLFQRALRDIEQLKIGPVRHVISSNSVPLFQLGAGLHDHWMFQSPTNVLFEQAPHPLSQICSLIGAATEIRTACGSARALRGGRPFYSNWQFTIQGESATAQMFLAFEGSISDVQLHIIGQDGTIHIDQSKNCYTLDRRTTYAAPIDSFLRPMRLTADYAWCACRQFAGYALSLFKIAGRNDVYYLGMKGSIASFYQDLLRNKPHATSLQNGVQTIEAIQRVVDQTRQLEDRADASQLATNQPSRPPSAIRLEKVLVIGAGGFIGRHLTRRLVEDGYDVRVLVRSPAKIADLSNSLHLEVVQGSIEDKAAVDRAVAGCRTVINLVAGAPETWEGFERLFVDGVQNVADAVLRHGVERLFHTSSIAALDLSGRDKVVTEASPTDARYEERCFYSKAKILGEMLLEKIQAERGLPCAVFRPGLVVGAGTQPQHLGVGEWSSEITCVRWGRDLTNPLPFVLVDDVVAAFVGALKLAPGETIGRKFNLVGDVQLSAQQYIEALRFETARDFTVRPHSVLAWSTAESAKWAIKLLARKAENVRLTRHELAYRTAASRVDCSDTKRLLGWHPSADRETFVERGIRAAVREIAS